MMLICPAMLSEMPPESDEDSNSDESSSSSSCSCSESDSDDDSLSSSSSENESNEADDSDDNGDTNDEDNEDDEEEDDENSNENSEDEQTNVLVKKTVCNRSVRVNKSGLDQLQLVWAKCRGFPWFPALVSFTRVSAIFNQKFQKKLSILQKVNFCLK